MNADLPSRSVILVTGSSSGIGRACCDLLGVNAIVYGASRSKTSSERWTYVPMDVTDDASVDNAVQIILSQHGRIDAVVHCAGISSTGSVEDTTVAEALAQFDTNYFGTLRVLRAVLPAMRNQSYGKIVIIGSIGGLIGLPFQAHYSGTKFALDGMVEAMRNELLPFNIFVSVLHPGNFKTASNDYRVFAKNVAAGSAYHTACDKAARFYADQELSARAPNLVASKVDNILHHKHPQRQYLIGTPLELVGVFAKRLLPSPLFDHLIRFFYFP